MLLKFCGMKLQEDLDCAAELGANLCGFIFHRKSPRFITFDQAARLNSHKMIRVGVFVNSTSEEMAQASKICKLDLLQFHGKQSISQAIQLGAERIIRVIWPEAHKNMEAVQNELDEWANYCSLFLLDAGHGGGGSGQTLAWQDLANLRAARPWLLAGGLNPENLENALAACSPAGIDLNSGVEREAALKDHEKMRRASLIIAKKG